LSNVELFIFYCIVTNVYRLDWLGARFVDYRFHSGDLFCDILNWRVRVKTMENR